MEKYGSARGRPTFFASGGDALRGIPFCLRRKEPKTRLGRQIAGEGRALMICPLRTPVKGTGASVEVQTSLSGVRDRHLGSSFGGLRPGATRSADLRTQWAACLDIKAKNWLVYRFCQTDKEKILVRLLPFDRTETPILFPRQAPKGVRKLSKASRHKAGGRRRNWRTVVSGRRKAVGAPPMHALWVLSLV